MIYDYLFLAETKKWAKWMEIIDKFDIGECMTYILYLMYVCMQHLQ